MAVELGRRPRQVRRHRIWLQDSSQRSPRRDADVQVFAQEVFDRADSSGLEKGHPELAIEVISPTSKAHDRLRKLDWYASIGVPEYWIVDGEAKSIQCFRLEKKRYVAAEHAAGDETFRPKAFKGLKIPLAKLFKGA